MKTTRRLLAVLLAMTLLLSGLSPAAAAEPADTAEPTAAEAVTLTVWASDSDQDWLAAQTEAFAQAHPEWDITWKLESCFVHYAADTVVPDPAAAADVYLYANDQMNILLNAGALAPISGEALEQITADHSATMVNTLCGPDGNVYGVPMSGNTWFMYYDKRVFSEEDVTSLDAMLEKGIVSFPFNNSWYLGSFYFANGCTAFGEYGNDASAGIQFGGEKGTAVTKYLVELLTHPNIRNDADGTGYYGLKNGTVDAYFSGSWDYYGLYEALGENLGAAQLPTVEMCGGTKQLRAFAGSRAFGVNPHSDNVEASMALAAFLGTAEAQKARFDASNAIPSITSLAEDPVIASDITAVAQINTTSYTAVVQPTIPEMNLYWGPLGTMGSDLVSGFVNADNAAALTEAMNNYMNGRDSSDPAETTISLWTYPIGDWGNEKVVSELIADFEAANPGIHVEVTYLDYMTGSEKLNSAIEAGAAPDLILEGPELLVWDLGSRGLLLDLEELLDDADTSEIYPNALAAGYHSNSSLYQYPLAGTVHTMAINKTVFEAAGAMQYLNEETHTWNSTEDFFKAVDAVHNLTSETVGMVYCGGLGGDQGTRALVTNLYGGTYTDPSHRYYTWNTEENIAALQALYDYEGKGIDFNTIFVGGDEIQMFRDGSLSMSFCWNMNMQVSCGGVTNNGDEILFMAFPSNGDPQLQSGVWGFGVFDNGSDERAEAAKTFVEYMCSSEATADAVRTAGCFAVRDSVDGNSLSGVWADDDVRSDYTKLMPMMGDYYMVTPNWRDARICWYMMLQDVANGRNIEETAAYWDAMVNTNMKTQLNVLVPVYSGQTFSLWEAFEAEYEAANENIDLVVETVSWNDLYTVLDVRLAAGEAPDILGLDQFSPYLDQLLPIDSYLSDSARSKIYSNFLNESASGGSVWAVPNFTSTRALYYNPDILSEAGAAVPTTWAELEDACAAIKAHYGDAIRGWGIDMTENQPFAAFALTTWSNGGGFVDENKNWTLNSDANVEALEFLMDLESSGYTNDAELDHYQIEERFAQGEIAMMISNYGFHDMLSGFGANFGVAILPSGNGQPASSIGVMDRLMCFDNGYTDEELAAVTAFFDLYYDDEVHANWIREEGFLPATASAMERITEEDPSQAVWADLLPTSRLYPSFKTEWRDVIQGLRDVMSEALAGGDIRTLLNNLQSEITGVPVVTEVASGWSGATTWTLTSDGVLTFSGNGNMKNYGWGGNQPWAAYSDQITSVVIENGVTAVGTGAFKDLTALESVTLPDSGLNTIGQAAFYGCTSLKSIYIPDGVYTIWEYTFKNCSSLEYIRLPKTLIKIDQGAFEACTALTELFLPTNVQIIGGWSFKGCTAMKSVDMQWADATTIRPGAFKNCTALTKIVLPADIQVLGDSCFYGIGATSFVVPATVTEVQDWCFARSSVKTITFEGDAPSIGTGAFNKISLTAYYPAGNATWTSAVMQNYGGNVTWSAA